MDEAGKLAVDVEVCAVGISKDSSEGGRRLKRPDKAG